jgi:hypothetical protein
MGRYPPLELLGVYDTHMTAAALDADVGLVADVVRKGPEASVGAHAGLNGTERELWERASAIRIRFTVQGNQFV